MSRKLSSNVDKRNKLNDLTAKQWVICTKSVWTHSDYDLDEQLSENLRHFKKIILFFSKKGNNILITNNNEQLQNIGLKTGRNIVLKTDNKVDLIISEESYEFSDLNSYKYAISNSIKNRYAQLYKKLKINKYLIIITRNFYFYNSELVLFNSDLNSILQNIGFNIKGMILWLPKNKPKEEKNKILHDNIIIFRKEEAKQKNLNLYLLDNKNLVNETIYYRSFTNSIAPPRDKFKSLHPATFSESDIKDLIKYFNKNLGEIRIFDPFSGVGSTLLACAELNVEGWGIELTKKWIDLTIKRFQNLNYPIKINGKLIGQRQLITQKLIFGDTREKILEFQDNFFDFIVTSPPYWGILTKKIDHKTRRERVEKGLELKYTIQGKDKTFQKDLANIESYNHFLDQLGIIFDSCFKKLKNLRYMTVIVSDFRHGSQYFLYHADIARILKKIGFKLIGVTILNQDNKRLYPYGYPYVFVPNIHHQNIIIVKKEL